MIHEGVEHSHKDNTQDGEAQLDSCLETRVLFYEPRAQDVSFIPTSTITHLSENTKELWPRRPCEQFQASSKQHPWPLLPRSCKGGLLGLPSSKLKYPWFCNRQHVSNTLLPGPKGARWEHQPGSLQGSDGHLPSLPSVMPTISSSTLLRRSVSLHSFLDRCGLGFQMAKDLIVFMILPTPDFPNPSEVPRTKAHQPALPHLTGEAPNIMAHCVPSPPVCPPYASSCGHSL